MSLRLAFCGGKRRRRAATASQSMASLLSFTLPKPNSLVKCSSLSPPPTTQPPCPPQLLEEKFGRKGIRFTELGNVELTVRNGSSLSVRIADGLVTSYRPKVYWKDDGYEEVLHTVADGSDPGNPKKGGIGLVLNDVSDSSLGGLPCCTSEWVVKDVDSDAIDALQVELSSTSGDGTLEIMYVISLFALSMATAVIVKNNGRKTVKLSSAILTHLKFKSRRGSAIQGLKGCSYCTHPPLPSSFGIMSPADAMVPEPPGWFSFFGSDSNGESKPGTWTVENDLYTTMRGKLSRVYTAPPTERVKRIYRTPPSKYETIDQGSGLGFRVIRMGYDDIYLGSPGSFAQKYGKGYFICTGPATMLEPAVLNPGEEWRGAQVIEHDNL